MTFTVDVDTWARGGNSNVSAMRTLEGLMCCLGQRAKALGQSARSMTKKAMPADIKNLKQPSKWKEFVVKSSDGFVSDTSQCFDIAETNDDSTITDARRKARLRRQFAELGDTIKFSDDPKRKQAGKK